MEITECAGYKKLLAAVEKNESESKAHNYRGHLEWIVNRAKHYAEKTGMEASDILDAWESRRTCWYMNYYQDCHQPELKDGKVRIFESVDELRTAIGKDGFRCPACGGISTSPYDCDSKKEMAKGKICDWKVYGLLGDLGKGIYIFVKGEMRGNQIFMPIAWEKAGDKNE